MTLDNNEETIDTKIQDKSRELHKSDRLTWVDKELISKSKALLVGVDHKGESKNDLDDHLSELELLAETFGIPVAGKFKCPLRAYSAATFITTGKLQELKDEVIKIDATLVVFDDEISPAQQRNLEQELGVPVMDRTEVILGVFADRARTREAKLQIELAQVKYLYPRLKRMWTHLSRQSGGGGGSSGGGYLKGEGEKQIEIDRRILKRKIERLEKEIKDIRGLREVKRTLRERTDIPVFAIVGYTNAGKSTLMKALTQADVYIEDKLFATLDTTTRRYTLPNNQEVLLIDTVGFIRKLPHLLVAAFRSTLEEAVQADVLIHLIDASSHAALDQATTTLEVLKALNAKDTPVVTVLNKVDRLQTNDVPSSQNEIYQKLKLTYPRTQEISAKAALGIDNLLKEMMRVIEHRNVTLSLRIPQSEYKLIAEAIRLGKVLHKEYEENDVIMEVVVPCDIASRFEPFLVA